MAGASAVGSTNQKVGGLAVAPSRRSYTNFGELKGSGAEKTSRVKEEQTPRYRSYWDSGYNTEGHRIKTGGNMNASRHPQKKKK